ncbi:MAG TPA: hypothetical protein VGK47_06015 [Nitrososphaeraceae archaeon]
MVLTYIVELKTSKTFTSRKNVNSENDANLAVEGLKKRNKAKGYMMYSGFRLYDQLNVVNRQPQIIKQWQ